MSSDPHAPETLEPDDPLARPEQTFPRVSPEVAERIAAYGREEKFDRGHIVFERGDHVVDFFFIVEGAIELFQTNVTGVARTLIVLKDRQFLGELNLFSGRAALVSARVPRETRVLRIKRDDFRRMVSVESDIGELILRALILRRVGLIRHSMGGVVIVGSGHAGDTTRLRRFLTRNAYPHGLIDTDDDPDAGGLIEQFALKADQLPVVIVPGGRVIHNPAIAALADELGLTEAFDASRVYDVAVVGGGPAGLAAAVYAASEGLDTIVIEGTAPGGQAGTSSKIENYLGFPTGISGMALAGRAQVQAQKFGARLAISRAVAALDCEAQPFCLRMEDDQRVSARSVVIATGARYRKLNVPDYERFEGQGIHYAATAMEAQFCAGREVVVVGGGNSAGQAAVFLSQRASHLHMLVRSRGLAATMSDYLIRRIQSSNKITLHTHTEISALAGDGALRSVTWKNRDTGATEMRPVGNLFVMIGADPNTEWLDGCLALDRGGFVRTGMDAEGRALASPFATAINGIYAVGDVRSTSVKRIASAVGEGSIVVQAIHTYLNPGVE